MPTARYMDAKGVYLLNDPERSTRDPTKVWYQSESESYSKITPIAAINMFNSAKQAYYSFWKFTHLFELVPNYQ